MKIGSYAERCNYCGARGVYCQDDKELGECANRDRQWLATLAHSPVARGRVNAPTRPFLRVIQGGKA